MWGAKWGGQKSLQRVTWKNKTPSLKGLHVSGSTKTGERTHEKKLSYDMQGMCIFCGQNLGVC